MAYQILYPFPMTIDAESFKDAAKNFVKMNRSLNIANLIIADRMNHLRKVNITRFVKDGKSKIGLSIFPYHTPLAGYSSSDPDARYPAMVPFPGYFPGSYPRSYLAPTVRDNTYLHGPGLLRPIVPQSSYPTSFGVPVGSLNVNTVGMGPVPFTI